MKQMIVERFEQSHGGVPFVQLYAWAIDGCERIWTGTYAEIDAKAEARRCGGTCKAFPLYENKSSDTYAEIDADIARATKTGAAAWAGVEPQTLRTGMEPLTDEQIDAIMQPLTQNTPYSWRKFARAIEAAHGVGI